MSLERMLENSVEHDGHKEDFVFESRDFYWDERMEMRFRQLPIGHTEPLHMGMTDWALKQACDKHGVPYSYAKRCPYHLASTNLNWWREQAEKKYMIRTYDNNVRAYLSNRYHPVKNSWLLETVISVMEEVEYTLMPRSTVTADNMHLKILVADTVGGNYGIGVYINNGEIGDYKIRVYPMVQVTTCQNSIIFAEGFEAFHVGINETQLRVQVKAAMADAFKKSPEYINKMMEAEERRLPSLSHVVEEVCKQYNLSQEVHDDILVGTHGSETVMGLANGLSFAAQKVQDDRMRVDMEITAGRAITSDALAFQLAISEPEE